MGTSRRRDPNDNGGDWFIANSRKSAASINRTLRGSDVPTVLLQTIGAIYQPEAKRVVHIQIKLTDDIKLWQVEAALGDYEIEILRPESPKHTGDKRYENQRKEGG